VYTRSDKLEILSKHTTAPCLYLSPDRYQARSWHNCKWLPIIGLEPLFLECRAINLVEVIKTCRWKTESIKRLWWKQNGILILQRDRQQKNRISKYKYISPSYDRLSSTTTNSLGSPSLPSPYHTYICEHYTSYSFFHIILGMYFFSKALTATGIVAASFALTAAGGCRPPPAPKLKDDVVSRPLSTYPNPVRACMLGEKPHEGWRLPRIPTKRGTRQQPRKSLPQS
jgi:hypothetical protein